MLVKVFLLKDENLYLTVIISQNMLSMILKIYEDAFKQKEFGMKFDKHDLLVILGLLTEIIQ